jgi:F0F1-type ATP synthase delta subunit
VMRHPACCSGVLAQNDRLGELPAIADTFDDIMAAVRGEVKATVTTAEVSQQPQVQVSQVRGARHLSPAIGCDSL